MRYDCHMHMLLDGVYWRGAIDRHRDAVDIAFIQKCLEQYQKLGFVYLRDGGDRWGVGAKARGTRHTITENFPLKVLHLRKYFPLPCTQTTKCLKSF